MTHRIDHVVVVGRDAPLWLAAAVLTRALGPSGVTVEAVALPDAVTESDLYASLPSLAALHEQLGIDEATLLQGTGGALTLGWNFVERDSAAPSFLHPFGGFGSPIEGEDFFPQWLRARRHGLTVPLEDFSLTAAAARQGRLFIPSADSDRYGRSDYGYHLPAAAYANWLRQVALKSGVIAHASHEAEPERDAEGVVTALRLKGGRRIAGDFFVDAGAGVLVDTPDNPFESWRARFVADRVLTAIGPRFAHLPVYAETRAFGEGWVALRPCQTGTHITAAWSGGLGGIAGKLADLCGFPVAGGQERAWEPGLRTRPWNGNCVALGQAACRLDPLHDLELFAVQLGLVHLLRHFPQGAPYDASRDAYNRQVRSHFLHLRDFQSLHYALARYQGPFWESCRTAPLSGELAQRIDFFSARGEIAPWEEDDFAADSWRAFLVGHGTVPDSYPPPADTVPPELVKARFREMLAFVKQQVLRQPTHDFHL